MNDFNTCFDTIIGYDSIKKELERLCDMLCNPEKYEKLGVTLSSGLMLVGEPGIGKTTMANAFIKASGKKTFVCRKEKPDGSFVDFIRETFDNAIETAKTDACIVFLDDLDKFSNEDSMHCNSEEFVTVQSCMDKAKGSKVLVLATANDLRAMPNSLLRAGRFDKVIEVETPKQEDAEKIVEFYLKKKSYVAEVDSKEIAGILDGRSCAELESVINEAGVYAAFANKDSIDMDDIIKACMRIIYRAPMTEGPDNNPYLPYIAAHECGHAIIQEILEPGTVNLVSVCRHEGNIGGITSHSQDENYFFDIKNMENRVVTILGGKAATELTGKVDPGCNSDLHRAFSIVERFIDNYASYGFQYWEMSDRSSPELLSRRENAIYLEMEKYYQRAKNILIENKPFFEAMVKELLEKKVLLQRDVQRIRESL